MISPEMASVIRKLTGAVEEACQAVRELATLAESSPEATQEDEQRPTCALGEPGPKVEPDRSGDLRPPWHHQTG